MDIGEIKKACFFDIDEITVDQPFPRGLSGCEGFRIPGILRLSDGGLFAVCDARWSAPDPDAGGIDTIWALSDDDGATWRHGFCAYFPDTLGTPRDLRDATVCIDPDPVQTPDGAIHVFVNLGPTGVTSYFGNTLTGTGFIDVSGVKRLALTDDAGKANDPPETYGYYVGERDGAFSPILTRAGDPTGFAVDPYFNIFGLSGDEPEALTQAQIDTGKTVVQNLFYRDSSFHVFNTLYTLHLSSLDKARSWDCELIGDRIKLESESSVISSPGAALVTSAGRTVLPFYSVRLGNEGADVSIVSSESFIVYSDDCCRTFNRTAYIPSDGPHDWSGESKPVELPSGKIRLFFRSGTRRICYADYDFDAVSWDRPVVLPVLVHSDCNFGVLKKDGAILIAYARGAGDEARSRSEGRIYRFMLDRDETMILTDVFDAARGSFSYAALADGRDREAALFYDTCGEGRVVFKKIRLV